MGWVGKLFQPGRNPGSILQVGEPNPTADIMDLKMRSPVTPKALAASERRAERCVSVSVERPRE